MKHATDVLQGLLDKRLRGLSSTSRSVFLQVCIYACKIDIPRQSSYQSITPFIQLVDYKYGSEPVSEQKTDKNQTWAQSALKWNDPVRKVHFYKKETPWKTQPGEHPDLKTLVCK